MRILLAAMRCGKGDIGRNLTAHLRMLDHAATTGCELALFPEMSLTGSADPATHPERLIGLDNPAIAALADATGATGVGACFGVAERSRDGKPYITQVFAAAGRLIGTQRKRHLGAGEEAFTAGTQTVVFGHAGGHLRGRPLRRGGFRRAVRRGGRGRRRPGAVPRGSGPVRPAHHRNLLA